MERSALTVSLHVADVAATVEFYRDNFGFHETGVWSEGGKPLWAEVTRDGPKGPARLWFFSDSGLAQGPPMFSGLIYLFVEDVDGEAAKLGDAVTVLWGPEDQVYGLRELGVADLNGYRLVFARDLGD